MTKDKSIPSETDDRLYFPATERNREVLGDVLVDYVRPGRLLEIASGSGEHAVHIGPRFRETIWVPSDIEDDHIKSIDAWRDHLSVQDKVDPAVKIDAIVEEWDTLTFAGPITTLLCVNMIHIAPLAALEGVIRGAGKLIGPTGRLIFYGPFMVDGEHTSESNERFNESLKSRNSEWGVRDRGLVADHAKWAGFDQIAMIPMPANNQTLIFEKREKA